MPGSPTPVLGLTVPTIGGDSGIWGVELNSDLAIIDSLGIAPVISISVNTNVSVSPYSETFILATGGAAGISVVLPSAASAKQKIFVIKKMDSGVGIITITTLGGLIDGQSSYVRTVQYGYVRLFSDGVNYNVVGGN